MAFLGNLFVCYIWPRLSLGQLCKSVGWREIDGREGTWSHMHMRDRYGQTGSTEGWELKKHGRSRWRYAAHRQTELDRRI